MSQEKVGVRMRPVERYGGYRPIHALLPVAYYVRLFRRAVLALPMRSRLRREMVMRFFVWAYDRFNQTGQIPGLVFDKEVELEQTGALIDTAGTFHGRAGVHAALDELHDAFEVVEFRVARVVELASDRLLFTARFHARGRSGIEFDRDVGHLFQLSRGAAIRWDVFWEEADALEAVGLSE